MPNDDKLNVYGTLLYHTLLLGKGTGTVTNIYFGKKCHFANYRPQAMGTITIRRRFIIQIFFLKNVFENKRDAAGGCGENKQ
jgi:hypothetical protein